ncbi:hypothetical protein AaE_005947 [Aphanomyces astaci]|uniref:Tubulin--tyrosine ligase-like protein 9 n=1 Tax=Aphanomyces astaci TaxID=112090 RepID=A0A6A5AMN4_APHAT|nr:hypothetical protein AaE_005947 [Aphanomyces astaci]
MQMSTQSAANATVATSKPSISTPSFEKPPPKLQPKPLSLREMKSLAKTTKMTPDESAKFIIQGTTSARKKKRLAEKVKKRKQQQTLPTPEDLLQAQRHERRKLAHDRLVARQAKITLKKQKDLQAKAAAAAAVAAAMEGHKDDDSSESDNDVVDVAPSSSDEDVAEIEPETRDDQPPAPLVVAFNDVASSTGLVASTFQVDDRISRINAHLCNVQAEDNLRVLKSSRQQSRNREGQSSTGTLVDKPNQEEEAGPEDHVATRVDSQRRENDMTWHHPSRAGDLQNQETSSSQGPVEASSVALSNDHNHSLTEEEMASTRSTRPDERDDNNDEDNDDVCSDGDENGDEGDDEEVDGPDDPNLYNKSKFHTNTYMAVQDHDQPTTAAPTASSATSPSSLSSLPEWFQDQRKLIHHIVTQVAPPPPLLHDKMDTGRPVPSSPTDNSTTLTHQATNHSRLTAPTTGTNGAGAARRILSNLMRDTSRIKACQVSVDSALESITQPVAHIEPAAATTAATCTDMAASKKNPRPRSCTQGPISQNKTIESEVTKPPQRQSSRTPASSPPTKMLLPLVAPVPARPVTDYSSVFRNFYCIMTSFYERMKTDLTTTSTSKHIIQNRDVAIRFQCKLYTVWKNVMHDYTTVFGGAQGQQLTARSRALDSACVYDGSTSTPFTAQYRINSQARQEVVGIVVEALKKLPDWDELPVDLGLNTTWNLLWTWSKPRVDAMGDKMKACFDIAPETFILPNEYIPFVQAFKRRADAIGSSKNFWIMKPVALSRGRGISLLNDLGQVTYGQAVILQKYIENPLLLDGFKAFFYNEGFVRICTHRYNTDSEDMNDLFMHLTNSSIQKHGHMDQVSYVFSPSSYST